MASALGSGNCETSRQPSQRQYHQPSLRNTPRCSPPQTMHSVVGGTAAASPDVGWLSMEPLDRTVPGVGLGRALTKKKWGPAAPTVFCGPSSNTTDDWSGFERSS